MRLFIIFWFSLLIAIGNGSDPPDFEGNFFIFHIKTSTKNCTFSVNFYFYPHSNLVTANVELNFETAFPLHSFHLCLLCGVTNSESRAFKLTSAVHRKTNNKV